VEDKQNDPSIRPPFFWHHISRDRQIWAVTTTWQNAPVGSAQRALFDRGSTSGEHAPNWVTLWLLYSVFRSRDTRNNRSRRNGDSGSSSGSGTFWQQPVFDSYTDPTQAILKSEYMTKCGMCIDLDSVCARTKLGCLGTLLV